MIINKGKEQKKCPSPSTSNVLGNLQHVKASILHGKLSNLRGYVLFILVALHLFSLRRSKCASKNYYRAGFSLYKLTEP